MVYFVYIGVREIPDIREIIRTTVNCFAHFAQSSKFPTGGLADELVHNDFESALYASSSESCSSSLSPFFPFFFAFSFSFALSFASAAFVNLRFLAAGGAVSSSAPSGSSRLSDSYPPLYRVVKLELKCRCFGSYLRCSPCSRLAPWSRFARVCCIFRLLLLLVVVRSCSTGTSNWLFPCGCSAGHSGRCNASLLRPRKF